MTCPGCPRYDEERRVCKDGKMNPQKREQANEVVRIYGLRVICPFNDFREALIHARSGPLTRRRS